MVGDVYAIRNGVNRTLLYNFLSKEEYESGIIRNMELIKEERPWFLHGPMPGGPNPTFFTEALSRLWHN